MNILAAVTILSGVLSLLCLLALHFVSSEFEPSWRMVSEYAMGKHKQLLSAFFYLWGVCTVSCACLLWNHITSGWAIFGVVLVFVTGIGALMGGMFDTKHKLHGLAFGLGVPFLPIAALLVSYHLIARANWNNYQTPLLLSAHAIWISFILMVIAMMLLFSGFKKAGVPLGRDATPPKALPKGVIGINGYINRLMIICYITWCVVLAIVYLSF